MTTFQIELPAGDLASRNSASGIRRRIECALAEGAQQVVVDLSQVKSLSASFTDELFGVLLTRIGFDHFVRYVTLRATDKELVLAIAESLRNRIKHSEQARVSELLTSLVARRSGFAGLNARQR